MTSHYRKAGDSELRWLLSMSLPFRWRWVKWAYYVAVRRWAANAFDSCGPEAGDQCRHGMEMPGWMWAMQTSLVRTR